MNIIKPGSSKPATAFEDEVRITALKKDIKMQQHKYFGLWSSFDTTKSLLLIFLKEQTMHALKHFTEAKP